MSNELEQGKDCWNRHCGKYCGCQPLRNLPDGWKSKESSGGKIDDENVVVNFSKMVMKLWDGGEKDPCDNQIFLLVLYK